MKNHSSRFPSHVPGHDVTEPGRLTLFLLVGAMVLSLLVGISVSELLGGIADALR